MLVRPVRLYDTSTVSLESLVWPDTALGHWCGQTQLRQMLGHLKPELAVFRAQEASFIEPF